MTEMEFDEMMSMKMRESVAGRRLPDDFQDRLVRFVKRAKTAWRIRVVAVIVVVVASGAVIMGLSLKDRPMGSGEAMLVAADAPVDTTEVSGWFLLGYLRECIKRARGNKKKEEK